ncbi:MAG: hypothetical protein HC915_14945 [Anaerolineae bacterium]|nr:hypothetical protein [Anaerolineae bacterium]
MSDATENSRKLNPALQAVHDSMMQGLGQLADYFGYNRVMGELYAALLLTSGPLSLDELKERVHKSKASVSMNTRTLEYMGAVREVWVREDNPSNRKYYEAETDFWKILQKVLGGRELRDVERALAVLEESIESLRGALSEMNAEDQALAELYIQRIDLLSDFFRFAKAILTTILDRRFELDMNDLKGTPPEGSALP